MIAMSYKRAQKENPGNHRPDLGAGEGRGADQLEHHQVALVQ